MAFPASGSASCLGRQGRQPTPRRTSSTAATSEIRLPTPRRTSSTAAMSEVNGNGNISGSCRSSVTGAYQPPLIAPPLQPFTSLPAGYTQHMPPPEGYPQHMPPSARNTTPPPAGYPQQMPPQVRNSITSSANVRPLATNSSMSMMPSSPRDSVRGTMQFPISPALPYKASSGSKEATGTITNAKPFNSLTVSELVPADANWSKVTCEYRRPSKPTIEKTELHSEAPRARSPSIPSILHPTVTQARSLSPACRSLQWQPAAAQARSPLIPRTLHPTTQRQWPPAAAQARASTPTGSSRPCHPTMIRGQDCSPRAQTPRAGVRLSTSDKAVFPGFQCGQHVNSLINSTASTAASPTPGVSDFETVSRRESFQNARGTNDVMAPPLVSSKKKKWVSKLPRSSNTQLLHSLGRDLTQSAANGELDPLIGREKELEQMIQVLARRRKNNPLLIGDPGVGKTAVVEGLAQQIVNGEVPDMLAEKHIFQIPVAGLLAGTSHRGEFEARMQALIDEVVAANDHVIIFIDEIHSIVGAGRSGNSSSSTVDAAEILKPALARGEFQCIGATTLDEYRVHIEKDASLERRFQPITVRPTDIEETVLILTGLAPRYEDHHHVKYSDEAIRACVKFAAEYMPDRFLPDKAIDVFDEVGAFVQLRHQNAAKAAGGANDLQNILSAVKINEMALQQLGMEANSKVAEGMNLECQRMKSRIATCQARIQMFAENAKHSQVAVVTEEDVARVISTNTGIPLEKLSEDESMRMLNLEEQLSHRVVGQDPAIAAVSKALRRARVGLKSPNRPIASFLFCGPTGVGKTELCKALSDVYFGKDNAMIRLDMSEFMEMHSVAKLIGSPAGYVGYGDGNQLTDRIRRKPYTLVLFDEIEKAHSAVLNILLQVMDDGCLTDATGRSVSFKNALIIMTSNAGHHSSELQQFFSPEFLNRLDSIIPFSPLGKSQVEDIAELEFAKTMKHVEEHGATLTLSPRFKDRVIDEGFDAAYGARPLRRTVASLLGDELANTLLSQSLEEGEHVHVDVNRDQEVVVSRSSSRRNSRHSTVNLAEFSPSDFSPAASTPRNSMSSSRKSAVVKLASPRGVSKQSSVGETHTECPIRGNSTHSSIDACTDSGSTQASDADVVFMFPGPPQSPGLYRPKSGSC